MFFFDSYAIIELLNGNPDYTKYSGEILITTSLNLAEVYYHYLKEGKGNEFLKKIDLERVECLTITPEDAYSAMRFRYEHRKQKYSFADALGYTISMSKGLRFLTGDKEFMHQPNVEFVK